MNTVPVLKLTPSTIMAVVTMLFVALGVQLPWASGVRGEDAPPTGFACSFDQGFSWSYDAGRYASVPPRSLSFNITAIDLEAQSAVIGISNGAEGKLKVVRALNANHFLEVANEGFLNITTVYDIDPATGRNPAVHSRHFGFMGQPVFAQYAGSCTALAAEAKTP